MRLKEREKKKHQRREDSARQGICSGEKQICIWWEEKVCNRRFSGHWEESGKMKPLWIHLSTVTIISKIDCLV